jgi:hypothetical protein
MYQTISIIIIVIIMMHHEQAELKMPLYQPPSPQTGNGTLPYPSLPSIDNRGSSSAQKFESTPYMTPLSVWRRYVLVEHNSGREFI